MNRLYNICTTSYVTILQHEQAMNVMYNIICYNTTTWTGYIIYVQHHMLQYYNMNRLYKLCTTSYVTILQHEQAIYVMYNIIRYNTTTWTGYISYVQHHTLQYNNMNRLFKLCTTSYVTILQHEQAMNVMYNIICYNTTTWTGYISYVQHHMLQYNTTWTGYISYVQHHTLQYYNMNRLYKLCTTSYAIIQQHEQAI